MKVVFLRDAKGVAKKGEVKEVSEGYARNFLFAKEVAKPATDSSVKKIETENKEKRAREERLVVRMNVLAKELKESFLEFKKKSNGEEIYGSVSAKDIEEEILKKIKIKADVDLSHPIKKIGEYIVPLKLGGKVSTSVKVLITVESK